MNLNVNATLRNKKEWVREIAAAGRCRHYNALTDNRPLATERISMGME